jgi:peptidyl-prolyl cis-trans isomerase D
VPKDELSAEIVTRIFAVPVGKTASAPAGDAGRVVFKVTAATAPPFVTSTQQAATLDEQLRNLIGNDLLAQYVAQLQKDVRVAVNEQALRRAVGGEI